MVIGVGEKATTVVKDLIRVFFNATWFNMLRQKIVELINSIRKRAKSIIFIRLSGKQFLILSWIDESIHILLSENMIPEQICISAIDYQSYLCMYDEILKILMQRNLSM